MESKEKTVYLDFFDPMRVEEGRNFQFDMNVDLANIEKQIRDVELGFSGQMSMTKGGRRLTIRAEPGKYLITLANDDDEVIADYWDKSAHQGVMIDLMGDYWGATDICTDVNKVVEIALKFCETGRLTRAVDWYIDDERANEEDLLEPL